MKSACAWIALLESTPIPKDLLLVRPVPLEPLAMKVLPVAVRVKVAMLPILQVAENVLLALLVIILPLVQIVVSCAIQANTP